MKKSIDQGSIKEKDLVSRKNRMNQYRLHEVSLFFSFGFAGENRRAARAQRNETPTHVSLCGL
jgi:hypothetical protein